MFKVFFIFCLLTFKIVFCSSAQALVKKINVQFCDSSHVFIGKCIEGIDDNMHISINNGTAIINLSSILGNTSKNLVFQEGNYKTELIFMENGKLRSILRYRKIEGKYKKDGDWCFFDEKNAIEQVSTWRNDILIRTVHYDLSSKVKKVYHY